MVQDGGTRASTWSTSIGRHRRCVASRVSVLGVAPSTLSNIIINIIIRSSKHSLSCAIHTEIKLTNIVKLRPPPPSPQLSLCFSQLFDICSSGCTRSGNKQPSALDLEFRSLKILHDDQLLQYVDPITSSELCHEAVIAGIKCSIFTTSVAFGFDR